MQYLLSRCKIPFSLKITVYRIISQNSYEHKFHQMAMRNLTAKRLLFKKSQIWDQLDLIHPLKKTLNRFPFEVYTKNHLETVKDIITSQPKQLSLIFKLSCETLMQLMMNLMVCQFYRNE